MAAKKAVDEIAEKRKRIQVVTNKINADAKKKIVASANEVPNPYFLRYPTGVTQLDIDMGGGFPAGGLTTISGPDGAGKTVLTYMAMAMHQRIYGEAAAIAMVCLEFLPDYFFMRKLGVRVAVPDEIINQEQDIRKERGVPNYTADEIRELKSQTGVFNVVRGSTGEEALEAALKLFACKEYGIIAIDGLNSFISETEAKAEDIGDTVQQSSQASVLTRFVHRFHPLTLGIDGLNPTAMLATAQVRANRERANAASFMQKFIKNYTETFPWAIRHARLLGIMVWKGEKIKEGQGKEKEMVGNVLQWETIKGKAGTHDGIRGETPFTFEKHLDPKQSAIIAGFRYGVLAEQDGVITVRRPETGEILSDPLAGVEEVIECMNDLEWELSLRREILVAAGKTCTYR